MGYQDLPHQLRQLGLLARTEPFRALECSADLPLELRQLTVARSLGERMIQLLLKTPAAESNAQAHQQLTEKLWLYAQSLGALWRRAAQWHFDGVLQHGGCTLLQLAVRSCLEESGEALEARFDGFGGVDSSWKAPLWADIAHCTLGMPSKTQLQVTFSQALAEDNGLRDVLLGSLAPQYMQQCHEFEQASLDSFTQSMAQGQVAFYMAVQQAFSHWQSPQSDGLQLWCRSRWQKVSQEYLCQQSFKFALPESREAMKTQLDSFFVAGQAESGRGRPLRFHQARGPKRNATSDRPPHLHVEAWAEWAADHWAVEGLERSLSYRNLRQRSRKLAAYLKHMGVAEQQPVGIVCEGEADLAVAVLAVLFSGATVVPLLPEIDSLELLKLDLLVCSQKHYLRFKEELKNPQLTLLSLEQADLPEEPTADLVLNEPGTQAQALWIQGEGQEQSGFVSVSHQALTQFFDSLGPRLSVTAESRIRVSYGAMTAQGLAMRLLAWASGATIVEAENAPVSHVLGATVESSGEAKVVMLEADPTLELSPNYLQGRRVFSLFGPVELVGAALLHEYSETETSWALGRPLANIVAYVLDDKLSLAQEGHSGQLYLGCPLLNGDGPSRCISPFGEDEGLSIYATGLRVRAEANGVVRVLGNWSAEYTSSLVEEEASDSHLDFLPLSSGVFSSPKGHQGQQYHRA